MDPLKEAFGKIKEDIYFLQTELFSLKEQLASLSQNVSKIQQTNTPTHQQINQSQHSQQTNRHTAPTDTLIQNMPLEPLKAPNQSFSTGNEGVPTNRQTDKQTLQQTQNTPKTPHLATFQNPVIPDTFDEANKIISSLDIIKEQIKMQFEALTPQEMTVFTLLYSLEDAKTDKITYKTIATKLNLSESSIRDYINRLILKNIPINKTKLNNKTVLLSISESLRKNVSLSTVVALNQN